MDGRRNSYEKSTSKANRYSSVQTASGPRANRGAQRNRGGHSNPTVQCWKPKLSKACETDSVCEDSHRMKAPCSPDPTTPAEIKVQEENECQQGELHTRRWNPEVNQLSDVTGGDHAAGKNQDSVCEDSHRMKAPCSPDPTTPAEIKVQEENECQKEELHTQRWNPEVNQLSDVTGGDHVAGKNQLVSDGDTVSKNSGPSLGAISLPQHGQHALDKDLYCFDICPVVKKGPVKLNSALFKKNRERRNELAKNCTQIELKPGMVLLKAFISHANQVEIVKRCQTLGTGLGGFYQPGYRDGPKLHLWMMCLGKDWDPETRLYKDIRSIDGVKPPSIPNIFRTVVDEAIQASHAYLKAQNPKIRSVEEILPRMSPDLCIVNFYTESGKLGLHQDRDESRESIDKALPVVSFSIGDSADFLYSEKRDADNADKVVLESGDVLIFGGKSRLIFHGVPRIHPNTAPEQLLEETNLRPGRLNLTFRQF